MSAISGVSMSAVSAGGGAASASISPAAAQSTGDAQAPAGAGGGEMSAMSTSTPGTGNADMMAAFLIALLMSGGEESQDKSSGSSARMLLGLAALGMMSQGGDSSFSFASISTGQQTANEYAATSAVAPTSGASVNTVA